MPIKYCESHKVCAIAHAFFSFQHLMPPPHAPMCGSKIIAFIIGIDIDIDIYKVPNPK